MTREEFDKASKVRVDTLVPGTTYWHRSKFEWALPNKSVFVEPKNDSVVIVRNNGRLWEFSAKAMVVPAEEVRDVDELELLELPTVPDSVRR